MLVDALLQVDAFSSAAFSSDASSPDWLPFKLLAVRSERPLPVFTFNDTQCKPESSEHPSPNHENRQNLHFFFCLGMAQLVLRFNFAANKPNLNSK